MCSARGGAGAGGPEHWVCCLVAACVISCEALTLLNARVVPCSARVLQLIKRLYKGATSAVYKVGRIARKR